MFNVCANALEGADDRQGLNATSIHIFALLTKTQIEELSNFFVCD